MNISVIIPVYNAAAYIEKAVTSALFHNEVKEVVLVNDGSTDDSLAILQKLQQSDARIKIYHHENKVNKGRSASRNLALQKATQPFIAFLDADDFTWKIVLKPTAKFLVAILQLTVFTMLLEFIFIEIFQMKNTKNYL